MNNNTMLVMMLALGAGGGSLDMTTILTASNMLPEMPRMILAITGAQQRDARLSKTADELHEGITKSLDAGAAFRMKKTEVDKLPELKALLGRLEPAKYDAIVNKDA